MAITKSFKAKSPTDLAEHFDGMATIARERADAYRRTVDKDREKIKAEAYEECAAVVRATEFENEPAGRR